MFFALNSRALLAGCAFLPVVAGAQERAVLNEVVVSASRLRDQALIDVPASITVLGEQALSDSTQQHFEEALAQVPNLNWAAGSSRPRYFQIRGIGEREQYEGAPNSSVGFLIDDIDFSGVGMAATLFDIEQIEVLRGPQGARLGANALAGLIAMRSADPSNAFDLRTVADAGNYDTGALGVSASGPVESLDSAWRLSVQKYRSDGFRTNTFLRREDTNGRDELTARGKWRWHAGDTARLDLTVMRVDLDNGYDAFSIDNSRTTLSDAPGEDSQLANAGAVKWSNEFATGIALTAIATVLYSESVHAYDGDWGNAQSWFPDDYDFVYRADRDRQTKTFEVRLNSAKGNESGVDWLIGWYFQQLSERIDETSFSNSFGSDEFLRSSFDALNAAMFAQFDGRFAERWVWSLGLRGETRASDYDDVRGDVGIPNESTVDSARDRMLGGHVALSYRVADDSRIYATISRGYKAGGFNLGLARQRQERFGPEFLWNYELGWRRDANDRSWYADLTAFYMQRRDMQVRSGAQLEVGNPNSFGFVTQNVSRGHNYGLEASTQWAIVRSFELGATVGWLKTRQSGALNEDGVFVPPREQAHAPNYQVQFNATYRHEIGLMARVDYSAVDAFFFDVPTDHDQRSNAYDLVNLKLGFEADRWRIHAWARNVFDERYTTRGFYFGNEPPDYPNKLYTQNGDPRTFGVSAEWSFP